ncbi:MAG: hypothetical protein US81_C0029G0013 [Parcubacteria group bacterium GW2011_GWE2_38_18]|nr:MAG: hypothetical protein US81_C0029G0013 [Parcubacteria group bacterium GW2011_GWE2_38_18]
MFNLNLSKSKIFLFLNLVFIVGIFLASLLPIEIAKNDLWWFGIMCCVLVALCLLYLNTPVETRFIASFSLAVLAVFFLAFWHFSLAIPMDGEDKIWRDDKSGAGYQGKTGKICGSSGKFRRFPKGNHW